MEIGKSGSDRRFFDSQRTEYTSFDILGRVTGAKQTTDGGDPSGYTTGYTYTLGGSLDTETYPSGRVVKNELNIDGTLSLVESKKDASHGFWTYANSFTYNPAGAVTSIQLGNGHWESTVFNSRLQPTQIALGTTPNATDELKLNYDYGSSANNGNVQSQTITVPGMTYPLIQNYTYDSLNRITSATETSNSTQTWKQTFTFDRYGNRNFDQGNTTQPASFADPSVTNPTVNTANNRFASGQGYSYDPSGNTTADANGQSYVYDAENKMVSASTGAGTLGEYFYDGDGKRIKKIVPSTGEETIFVYDASGKPIAEYSSIVASVNDAKVSYLTSDHLGSPRINTDQNGTVTARHDYMPFGEEIVSIGRRNNGGDIVRKQFTAYERDGESNLDFAQARYHDFNLGRFSSPDPENGGAQSDIAQSWNGYLYVMNNPLNSTDPTGLIWLKQKGSELWEWVDDDVYKDNPDKYRGYIKYEGQTITAVGGTAVAGDPSLKGKSVILDMNSPNVYAVPDADLERATTHFGEQALPLQNLFDGFENQGHMRFWRPVIYTTGTVVMGLFGTPVTGAITGVDYFAAAQSARIARAAQLAFNQASGAIAESQATAELALNGINIVGRRVSANVPGFGRRVMDILVEYNGQLFNIEVKSGGAVRTTAQLTKDAAMEQGATLVGRNSGELTGTVQTIKTIVYPIP